MAALTTSQKYTGGEEVGRNLWFKTFSFNAGGVISQIQFDAAVKHIQGTASTEIIGVFTAGASVEVLFVISGADIADVANGDAGTFGSLAGVDWNNLVGWDAAIV